MLFLRCVFRYFLRTLPSRLTTIRSTSASRESYGVYFVRFSAKHYCDKSISQYSMAKAALHELIEAESHIQYIPRNMHTVFALLCFVVVIHWLIVPYPSGLLHWHCGNLTIAPVPAKQPWWIWINTSREFIMNDCITTTKQSTTKPCAYFLGYTVDLYAFAN